MLEHVKHTRRMEGSCSTRKSFIYLIFNIIPCVGFKSSRLAARLSAGDCFEAVVAGPASTPWGISNMSLP